MREALRSHLHTLSRRDSRGADQLLPIQSSRVVAGAAILISHAYCWSSDGISRTESQAGARHLSGARRQAPALLEQAGISPSDLAVLTRPVEADYVGQDCGSTTATR